MPHIHSPFKKEKNAFENTSTTDAKGFYQLLPENAKKQLDKSAHVFQYMQAIPAGIGTPKFYTELSRSMKSIKHPNLIYPINDATSIHICADKEDSRAHYIPIEPNIFKNYDPLIEKVEREISKIVDRYDSPENDSEKRENLINCITDVCKLTDAEENENNSFIETVSKFFKHSLSNIFGSNGVKKISVNSTEFEALKYLMVRDKVGLGVLEPLICDPNIEDISCAGINDLFVEHKIFESLKTPIKYNDMEDLNDHVIKLSEKIGKPLSFRTPILDATLPDGSRVNIVYGEDISKKGSNYTIRKFSGTPISVLQLIEFGTMDYLMAAYIWICLREGMNCFISGETASGKTTTMNAITTFIPPMAKIVSIEDTPELQVPHTNWLREVTRGSGKEGEGSGVEMFDLLKAALRQRPNEIIVGEIRGAEGNIVFQGMQTGHPAMATFHASSVEKLVQRLTGDPISVPKTYVDNLNFVILQNAVRGPDGKMKRRITGISEIIGYDAVSQSFSFIEAFKWDPASDTFAFLGNNNSYVLERKIAPMKGIPSNKVRKMYKEVEKRARVLKKIHKSGVIGFYELFAVLSKMENENIF